MRIAGWLVCVVAFAVTGCATANAVAQEVGQEDGEHQRQYRRADGTLMVCDHESMIGSHRAEVWCTPVEGGTEVAAQYALDKLLLVKPTRTDKGLDGH